MSNVQDNAAHTCSYSCDRPQCIKAQRDELAAAALNAQPAAAQEAVAWQRRYARPAPDGSRYEWHEISREQYLEASKTKWANDYELRELFDRPAPVTAAPGIDLSEVPRYTLAHGDFTSEMLEHSRGAWVRLGDVESALLDASPKGGSEARDAARYRWLRDLSGNAPMHTPAVVLINYDMDGFKFINGPQLDGAIDAAMREQASDAEVRP